MCVPVTHARNALTHACALPPPGQAGLSVAEEDEKKDDGASDDGEEPAPVRTSVPAVKREAVKRLLIKRAPEILTLHLKR